MNEKHKCRVRFKCGLETIVYAPIHEGVDNFYWPQSFITGRPDKIESVEVFITDDFRYRISDGKLPVYVEK